MADLHEIVVFLDIRSTEEGWSRHTRTAYRSDLTLFEHFATNQDLQIGSADSILRFIEHRRIEGDGPRTLNRRLAAVRSFRRYLVEEGLLDGEIAPDDLPVPQRIRQLPHFLSVEDMQSLLAAPQGSGALALRDRTLIELLYATGARASELCGLTRTDLHRDETGAIRALKVHGKGGKERFCPVHQRGIDQLEEYLRGRHRLARPDSPDRIFLTRTGRALGRQALYDRLRHHGLAAGISQRVTPHLLRHTFATHLVHEGADLRIVQELLGHARLSTTTIYTSVDDERLKGIHRTYHPRG